MQDQDELQRIKDTFGVRIDSTFKSEALNNDIVSGGFNYVPKKVAEMPSDSLIFQSAVQASQSYTRSKVDNDAKLNQLNTSLALQQKQQYNRHMGGSQIPSVLEYLSLEHSSSQLDPSRTICTLGMLFETVGNCSILK